ncbi:hypothetical protein IDJ75_07155 [Mucilaginibacter rigui]|uniref:Uncharacterized protein n=1 Tax=Mucilaginibacter rigui TaxID=534635 RepID=A0ABR7X5D8_9SPHI|nr:hypothetical protein [Mucilaginibacter rigui]MBD1385052.1 hypothetical protein [Mucilaginibacter rigui]
MNKLSIIILITASTLLSCQSKTSKAPPKKIQSNSAIKSPAERKKPFKDREYVDQMTFVEYLDDGDYFQIYARKGSTIFYFINDTDTARNVNKGDLIQIRWKDSTVTVPGDNDSKMPAQILLDIKKTGDGPVSIFRKTYGKKLKYTWPTDEELAKSYLNKVYLIVEYFLTQTKNPLLRNAIKNRDELTYSIEKKNRGGQDYRVIGIAPVGENGSNIVQWLYIDDEYDKVYEYDLPEDKLIQFN